MSTENQFIQNTFVGQLCQKLRVGGVISVSESATVTETLNTFAMHKIMSAPVTQKDGAVLGVVHLIDIVCYLTTSMDLSVPIKRLLGMSHESKSVAIFESTDRMTLLMKSLGSRQHHLALVSGKQWKCVITQSDVVRFLREHIDQLPSLASTPVSRVCGAIRRDGKDQKRDHTLVALHSSATVKDGMKIMAENDFDSLPIVRGDSYELVGVLQSHDLRSDVVRSAAQSKDLGRLFDMNVVEFEMLIRRQSQKTKPNMMSDPEFVSCSLDEPFGRVLDKIVMREALQAWVIQANKDKTAWEVFGVLSLNDIIGAFQC